MNEREQIYWQRFLATGQITDYLRYRKYTAEREPNPRRRIEESTKQRKFY